MKLTWKKPVTILDGVHQGKIVRIEYRTDPYEYADVVIELLDEEIELRYGCPTILSEDSRLGGLMQNFGHKFEEGKEIDIEAVLVGNLVNFMTLEKEGKDKKKYAEIVRGSIKPI